MRWRNSRKPRAKEGRIKCHVIKEDLGKIMVTDQYGIDRIISVNPADIKDGSVKVSLTLLPTGVFAIFRSNEKHKPFEVRDEDLIIEEIKKKRRKNESKKD